MGNNIDGNLSRRYDRKITIDAASEASESADAKGKIVRLSDIRWENVTSRNHLMNRWER